MRYIYLFTILIIVSCSSLNKKAVPKQEKPNILFLFADDQMFNTIGALENCPVKTPHLDELMKNGVSFSRTYNQGSYMPAVCVASRTMILTGGYIWKAASFSKKLIIF